MNQEKYLGVDVHAATISALAMLAVILVIVVETIRPIGSNANTVFSQVPSFVQ